MTGTFDRREFLKLTAGQLASSAVESETVERKPAEKAAARRGPNIILIVADDLGYGDLSCYGNQEISTPNLDRMAADGVRFTDFHSSAPVCSPTRAGLLTGRYQQRCGITEVILAAGPRTQGLAPEEITFSKELKRAGYRTALFGKWHLGYLPRFNPDKHGFEEFRGFVSGNVDYVTHIDQAGYADWWHNSELSPEEGYTTELITRHSVRFIEENKERPFFLYIAHAAPHSPYQAPGDPPRRLPGQPVKQRRATNVGPTYRKMIEAMDEGIGRVLGALRAAGIERDTFVFFFSDNGATHVGSNGPFRGLKGSLWEGGHRVPAIAYWPGTVPGGRVSHETATCLDLFPTFLAVAGVPLPKIKLDGVNLLPHLTQAVPLGRRRLFWAYNEQRAMREGRWKLVTQPGQKPFLSDLAADPGEQLNLADSHPARVIAMTEAIAAWEKEVRREA